MASVTLVRALIPHNVTVAEVKYVSYFDSICLCACYCVIRSPSHGFLEAERKYSFDLHSQYLNRLQLHGL